MDKKAWQKDLVFSDEELRELESSRANRSSVSSPGRPRTKTVRARVRPRSAGAPAPAPPVAAPPVPTPPVATLPGSPASEAPQASRAELAPPPPPEQPGAGIPRPRQLTGPVRKRKKTLPLASKQLGGPRTPPPLIEAPASAPASEDDLVPVTIVEPPASQAPAADVAAAEPPSEGRAGTTQELDPIEDIEELEGAEEIAARGIDAGDTDARDTDARDTDAGDTDAGDTDAGDTDAGNTDAGNTDAGDTDAGDTDAGNTDAGDTDAGDTDAGDTDAGDTDAGDTDAGDTDAGDTDAGDTDDTDGGDTDAGEPGKVTVEPEPEVDVADQSAEASDTASDEWAAAEGPDDLRPGAELSFDVSHRGGRGGPSADTAWIPESALVGEEPKGEERANRVSVLLSALRAPGRGGAGEGDDELDPGDMVDEGEVALDSAAAEPEEIDEDTFVETDGEEADDDSFAAGVDAAFAEDTTPPAPSEAKAADEPVSVHIDFFDDDEEDDERGEQDLTDEYEEETPLPPPVPPFEAELARSDAELVVVRPDDSDGIMTSAPFDEDEELDDFADEMTGPIAPASLLEEDPDDDELGALDTIRETRGDEPPALPDERLTPPVPPPLGAVEPAAPPAPPVPAAASPPPSREVPIPPATSAPPVDAAPVEPPPAPPGDDARRRPKAWFEEIFDEDHLRTMRRRGREVTIKEVNFLEESLQPARESEILDIGCGDGRHAIEFAGRGYHVTGFDRSLPLLIRAADEAQARQLTVNFVQSDFRELSYDARFDAAYCMATSFGYFDDDTNRKMIGAVNASLKPGGRFLLDVVNRDYMIRDIPARVWWEGEGCVVLEEVDFNYFTSRVISKRSVVLEDGRHLEQEISVRAYSLHELGKVLHHAGFRVLEVSGNMAHRTRFFGAHSMSLLMLAEKRAG